MKIFSMMMCMALGLSVYAADVNEQQIQVREAIVRDKASLLGKQVIKLGYGVKVNVLEVKGRWSKISFMDKSGWVRSTRLTTKEIVFKAGAEDAKIDLSDDEAQTAARGGTKAPELGEDPNFTVSTEENYSGDNPGMKAAFEKLDALETDESYTPEPSAVNDFAKEGKLKEVPSE